MVAGSAESAPEPMVIISYLQVWMQTKVRSLGGRILKEQFIQ